MFGGKWALLKSSKNHFPMVRVINFRSFSSFFCECWALLESFKHDFPMVRAKIKSQKFQVFVLKNDPLENHENTTFRTFLEPWGPRDRPWIQERKILFRIALTRALYDQTAPQLCPFYGPGKLSFSCLVFFGILAPLSFE